MNNFEILNTGINLLKNGGLLLLASETIESIQRHYAYKYHITYNLKYSQLVEGYNAVADPYEPIFIDPNNVSKCGLSYHGKNERSLNRHTDTGKIIGGSWDLENSCQDIRSAPKYKAVIDKYENGLSWEETGIYDNLVNYIKRHGSIDGCYNRGDLERRYQKIDELYNSIKNKGYKQQSNLSPNKGKEVNINEVCVSIGRDGNFIFGGGGGWHRLAIANVLGIEKIPVHIIIRHKYWQDKREEVSREKRQYDHPDMNNF